MNPLFRGVGLRGLHSALLAALLVLLGPLASGQTIPDSAAYVSNCSGCHRSPLHTASMAADVSYPGNGAILTWSAIDVTGSAVQIETAMKDVTRLTAGGAMRVSYSSYITGATQSDLLEIQAYLRAVRDLVVTPSITAFDPTVFNTTGTTRDVVVSNLRGSAVAFTFSKDGSYPGDFPVSMLAATGCSVVGSTVTVGAATDASTARSCTLRVSFTPAPTGGAISRTARLRMAFAGDSDPTAKEPSPPIDLIGMALDPFTVSPLTLQFTPAVVTGVLQTTITDRVGDRLRICRGDAADFSFPADYTIDAPYALGVDGCVTTTTSGTASASTPRSIPLDVRFAAGAAGPRNAILTLQRVDAGATPLGTSSTVQLKGNPGPLAMVNATSLFDAPADPGVEVDNDNVLDRSITISSRGSQALAFTVSSFTISGASLAEYSIVPGGCQALASLPAYTVDPAPSCVLTLRFNPSDVGRRGPATLTIQATGAADNVVSLNGLGIRGPRLAVLQGATALASLDVLGFGAQTVGGLYPATALTLRNGGSVGSLEVVLPTAGSVSGFSFDAGAGCGLLAPAAECTVNVRFAPSAAQAYASSFLIQHRPQGSVAAYSEFRLNLQGQGSANAVPVLSWTDMTGTPITQLAFADTDAGTTRTGRVRLYNAGPGGTLLQLTNVVGLDASNFVLDTSACPNGQTLFQATSCEIVVQFAPGSAGLKAASIQAATSGSTPPMLVAPPLLAVSGVGIASATPSALTLSSNALRFANTVVGAAGLPLELRLMSSGSRSLLVQGFAAAAPFAVQSKTCPAVPFTLTPGSECSVTVTFAPQAQGEQAGSLHITTDASPAAVDVALSGQGDPKASTSSGGCSIAAGDSAVDPVLWTLVLLATVALIWRRREAGSRDRHGPGRRGER